jgi:hypothetical protein
LSTPIKEIIEILDLSQNKKASPRILPDEALYKKWKGGIYVLPTTFKG